LFRLGKQDARLQTFQPVDKLYTEDVGNGMGGKTRYYLKSQWPDGISARWFHVVLSADGEEEWVRMWLNGAPVKYDPPEAEADHIPWPPGGGMQINYDKGTLSDGAVIGRWLSGHGVIGQTIGVASVVIVRDAPISQEQAAYLHRLGRLGIPFDGTWFKYDLDAPDEEFLPDLREPVVPRHLRD